MVLSVPVLGAEDERALALETQESNLLPAGPAVLLVSLYLVNSQTDHLPEPWGLPPCSPLPQGAGQGLQILPPQLLVRRAQTWASPQRALAALARVAYLPS